MHIRPTNQHFDGARDLGLDADQIQRLVWALEDLFADHYNQPNQV